MVEMNARVVLDPKVCSGRPIIKGTRIPVSIVVGHLAAGETIENVMEEYGLEREDVLAALSYATMLLEDEEARAV
jgi:uncharacterized protein (DUF433 family)